MEESSSSSTIPQPPPPPPPLHVESEVIIDAFVTACSLGQEAVVRKRIQTWSAQGTLSINLARTDMEGRTAVSISCEKGHLLVLLTLIKAGASLVDSDPDGFTPLHVACKWGRSEIVLALLDGGSLPCLSRPCLSGSTPLHLCALNGHPECLKLLCLKGADPKVRDESGRTPLGCGMQSKVLRQRENGLLYKYEMEVFRVKVRRERERGKGGGSIRGEGLNIKETKRIWGRETSRQQRTSPTFGPPIILYL